MNPKRTVRIFDRRDARHEQRRDDRCEKPKGPVEKAGEKVDKAVDKVSDAVDPKGPAEKAGRAIDRATDGH